VAPKRDTTNLWITLALILLTAGLYAPVRHYGFLSYDDPAYVTQNPLVKAGLTRDGIVWAWTGVHQATWHPLTTLSHMLDCQLFGLDPGAHHLVNLLLHILNTVLLFGFLARTTALPWRSACVAALFAVHPLHVESVAWISERKDVLSTFFAMLTLWAYVGYVRRPGVRQYALLLLAYVAALLSKPMVVTLPFVLLLLDVWPLRRIPWQKGLSLLREAPRNTAIEKLPLVALAGIVGLVTFVVQRQAGAVIPVATSAVTDRLANAVVAYAAYLGKMVWPTGLAVFYPFEAPLPLWQVLSAGALMGTITVFVVRYAPEHLYLFTGWFWYLATLVPVSGLVRVGGHSMADRFTYVPLIGVFVIVAWGIPDLLGRWRHRHVACAAAALLALGACTVLTARQRELWQDTRHLFQHALAVTRDNYVAHFMIGTVLLEEGRREEAFTHFSEAARIEPTYFKAEFNMGLILAARGDHEAAKQHYLAALQTNPAYTDAHNSLGVTLAAQGDAEGAVTQYREALRLDPAFGAAHNNLAATLAKLGQTDEAIVQYTEAIRLSPQHAEPHGNIAMLLQAAGRLPEAIEQLQAALQLNPRLVDVRYRLATAYAQTGRPREAETELGQVLRERPEWSAAEATLAWLLATADDEHLRDGARAVQLAADAAQRTQQRDPNVLNSLAAAYAEVGRYSDAIDVTTQAIEVAQSRGQTALRDTLADRLAQYRTGQPVRERRAAPR
jgi:tetratricopeptide (TPR) repeat protein